MLNNITEKQGQYLSFIYNYIKLNGQSPAESDIQKYFKVSPPTVHQMVIKLETQKFIKREPGVARSIKVLVTANNIPPLK